MIDLNIAINAGASLSVMAFKEHEKLWSDIAFADTIKIKTLTLEAGLEEAAISLDDYDSIVLDAQV
ncbi:MAG: hypothetical protein VKO39_09760 [Cyanobacteriota bacterium]|nr:hypothetical protein [Cyanobacteriota bacterium]